VSRPFSWFPLAGADPVPGDPVAVRAAGDRYVQIGETIDTTANQLRRLTEADGTISEAVSAGSAGGATAASSGSGVIVTGTSAGVDDGGCKAGCSPASR